MRMAADVVELILQDHREVERLFEELRDPAKRATLVPVLTTLLTAHSRAEESQVYPAARDEAGIAEDVEHSQQEHVEAEELLAKLAATDPDAKSFDTLLQQVVDAVTHHVQEEEASVLPAMREQLEPRRLAELGQAFLASRGEHLGEQPQDVRRSELQQQARNMGLKGTSGSGKEELQDELRRAAAASSE